MTHDERVRLAEIVREACARAAQRAYEDAASSGLCAEGAQEAAIGAIRMLELNDLMTVKPKS